MKADNIIWKLNDYRFSDLGREDQYHSIFELKEDLGKH